MTNFKARPTTYKGIEMRSRLEAGCATWLDEVGLGWEYEPQCFASDRGQYLPDFFLPVVELIAVGTVPLYLECKPLEPDWDEMAANLAIIRASVDRSFLVVMWPGRTALLTDPDMPHADAHWIILDHLGAVALALPSDAQPWPDGYWKRSM